MILDANNKTFVVHVAIKKQKMPVHLEKQAQTEAKAYIDTQGQNAAQVRVLLSDKALIESPAKYSDYNNVFSADNVAELPETIGIIKHIIKLEENKQPPFGSIYSLGPVKLEMLKTYIITNLANGFIRLFKLPANAFILFD